MYTYTITIGRGSGKDELDEVRWSTFEDQVNEELANLATGNDFVEVHHGVGEWEGASEDSTKTTLLKVAKLTPSQLRNLRAVLGVLAKAYGQDAIALTIGQSELITG